MSQEPLDAQWKGPRIYHDDAPTFDGYAEGEIAFRSDFKASSIWAQGKWIQYYGPLSPEINPGSGTQ